MSELLQIQQLLKKKQKQKEMDRWLFIKSLRSECKSA